MVMAVQAVHLELHDSLPWRQLFIAADALTSGGGLGVEVLGRVGGFVGDFLVLGHLGRMGHVLFVDSHDCVVLC